MLYVKFGKKFGDGLGSKYLCDPAQSSKKYRNGFFSNENEGEVFAFERETETLKNYMNRGYLIRQTEDDYNAWLNRNAPKPEEPKAKKEKAADKTATAVEENKEGA
jgi:hypothetical protein